MENLASWASPFEFEFFRRALVAALLVGGVAGLAGTYVVLRGMSYIGHGLAHAIFGGAVVAYTIHVDFYVGAGLWGVFAAWLIHGISRRRGIGADAAIGLVTTASFAVGILLISRTRRFMQDFEAALFGNILAVTEKDLWIIAGVSLGALVLLGLCYKEFLYTTFDRETAEVLGVPTRLADGALSLLLAAVVVASLHVIGVTMLAAAIVTPAITARLLTDRFDRMLWLSAGIGAITAATGMYLSFALNAASGATIVLTGAVVFGIVLAATWRPRRPAVVEPLLRHEHAHEHADVRHFHPHSHDQPHEHPPGPPLEPAHRHPDEHHPHESGHHPHGPTRDREP